MTIPRPPKGAGPAGKRLWRSVQAEFELGEHERALLVAMCRQVDRLDELEALIAAEGLMVTGHGTMQDAPGRGRSAADGDRGGEDRGVPAAAGWRGGRGRPAGAAAHRGTRGVPDRGGVRRRRRRELSAAAAELAGYAAGYAAEAGRGDLVGG